jgi:hypothetical protein
VHATVDVDYHNELINPPTDGTQSMVGKVLGNSFYWWNFFLSMYCVFYTLNDCSAGDLVVLYI